MKKYILSTLLFASTMLLLTPVTLAEEIQPPVGETVVTESDLFTPEQIAEWEKETPKPVRSDPKNYERARLGSWSWRPGLVVVTDAKVSGIINHGHAGITAAHPYYGSTIEANPGSGVKPHYGHWENRFSGQIWQLGVTTTSVAEDKAVAERAAGQIGKPYNWNFYDVWTRDRYYCSQLVWASFRDIAGNKADISLNDWGAAIHPFELRDHPNTWLLYRRK